MRIGITEKSHETRRDHWGGRVNHKSLFWLYNHSTKLNKIWWSIMKVKCKDTKVTVKMGIRGLHDHPSDLFLFRGFFQQSRFSFWNFQFCNIITTFFIYSTKKCCFKPWEMLYFITICQGPSNLVRKFNTYKEVCLAVLYTKVYHAITVDNIV